MRLCDVRGCGRRHASRGWCSGHYERWRDHGDVREAEPLLPRTGAGGVGDRFWSKVDRHGPILRPDLGPCWEWTAFRFPQGYGCFNAVGLEGGRRSMRAHRVAWRLETGAWPDGLVLHACDNPPCVRPSHLRDGTYKENADDMVARSRARKSRFSDQQIQEICDRTDVGESRSSIARSFGISPKHVLNLLRSTHHKDTK